MLIENANDHKLCNIDLHRPPLLIEFKTKNIKLQNKSHSQIFNYRKVVTEKVITELESFDWNSAMRNLSVDFLFVDFSFYMIK